MKNKPSFWSIMLVLNFLGLSYFYYWIITPMWYQKMGHHQSITKDLPTYIKVDKETEKIFLKYVKELDQEIKERNKN